MHALMDNLTATGHLNTDRIIANLLQYKKTPLQEVSHLPAELLYGRVLNDHLPSAGDLCMIRPECLFMAHDREIALAKKNMRNIEA